MLSFEKLPPDPPCHHPQPLIINDASTSHEQPLDLSNNPPLPKFSIRDYVFTSRSKNIGTNWPFSQKNLQLCLKHGVKDLLPPFDNLAEVRNQPIKRCMVESERKATLDVSKSSGQDDHAVSKSSYTKLKEKLTEACTDTTTTTSCRSEGENDFPSTLTSISQSEIEESVPTNRPSRLLLETDTSLEAASVEAVEAAGPPVVVVNKTGSTTRPSGKKCRLVVKFSSHSERSSTEDIASNITTISETMTSKICPVCKTFSSSSNTTLNAHIDQCLSGEATPKWTVDSKPITRYRIKPRKTKLMVDIYTTAQHCTLEDLDRRNGSSWATSVSSLPTQDKEKSEMPVEEKRKRVSSVHPDDIDVGPVYVDANGTKVRILSKFDDAPSPSVPKAVEHLRPRKPLKPGKGSKFVSAKKQKRHASKHHKYLKLAPQSKDFLSPKAHSSQIHGGQETCGAKENSVEGQQMEKQLNSCNPGALRGWASSKRTGVVKKLNKKHVSQNVLVESDQTCLDNCRVEGIRGGKVMNLSGNPISSPENSGSTENACDEAQASEKSDCFLWRTRAGSPFPGEQGQHQFSQDRTFSPNSCMLNRTYSDVNFAPVLSNNTIGSAADLTKNFDSPHRASKKLSKSRDPPRSNSRKFLPPKKNVSAIGSQVSLTESSRSVAKNCSAAKNQGQREEADKEVAAWDPEADQQHDFMHNFAGKRFRKDSSDEVLLSRSTVLQRRKGRGSLSSSRRNEPMALESSQFAPEFYGNDEREKMDTSGTVRDEYLEKVDGLGVAEREDQIHDRDMITEKPSLIGFCETKAVTSPTDPSISNDEQEMFYGDELQDGTLGQNVHSTEEMDAQDGQGSYFPEVDPILIPGPPGSFLPSPRDMGSDDFQGNSSLTTSRVQSSQDQLDFIDGDSSDSPVSTTSTISNSRGTKFDPKYSEPLSSIGPQSAQDKIGPGLSRAVSGTSEEINATVAQRIISTAADGLSFDRENHKVNKISLERGPISFKSNDQPCCCQRKDRTSQGVALNYQESSLLMRRAMAVPAMGMQMGGNPNTRTNTLESGSDMTGSFFLSGCTTSRSEQVVFPVTKSSSGHHPSKCSPDGKGKLSGHGDCDSVSPSASNSILRLMGKNLMVANKDEDASAPPVQAQPHAQTNQLTSQFPTFSGIVPGNLQNQFYQSFQHNFPHGSVILGQDPHNKVGECFRSYSNPRTPQVVARGPGSLFPKHRTDGSFVSSMEPHEHKGDCNFPMPQNMSIRKPIGGAPAFHMERIMNPPDRQRKNVHSAFSAGKEIIIIDDIPESEADLACNAAKYSEGLTESQVVCSSIPVQAAPSYNSKHVKNPFSRYESQEPSLRCGSPVLYNTTLHAVPSRLATNSSPVKWSCTTSEGSGVLQRAPFLAAPSPRGHLRSTLYSPSLS
ncbi:hypothetical protein ACFX19_029603 [Malus domestica]